MATNQDTPISLLDPHPSPLSGSEIFVFVQSGQTVNGDLDELKTFITSGIPVGTGDITGSGTSGKIPLFNAAKNIVNSRITQTLTTINIPSPNGSAYLKVEDDAISMEVLDGFYHRVYIDETKVGLAYYDGVSVGGGFESTITHSIVYHDSRITIAAPDIQFPNLTGNTVPYLDANKYMRSSGVTPTKLSYISTLSSDAQTQIDSLSSLIVGATNLRGSFTPSGSYPTTGGTGTSGAVKKGNFWIMSGISGSATMGGKTVQNGDAAIALVDTPGQTDSNWLIQEGNFGFTPLNQSMASGTLYIGNGSGIGAAVTLTGPVTVDNTGLTAIGTGAITDAMIASSFVKADGTIPLTADWYAGPYKIITDSVTIGDPIESIQAVGINGGTIYAEGDGLKVFAGGRGIILDSETAAIHILNGFFKVEPNKGLGKTWISDADGIMTLQAPSTFSMPSPTYANTSTTNTDTNIITCVIPGNTLVSNKDKVVYDFVIGNTGGISGDVSYKVKINSTSLPNDKTVTLNTSSDPITLRVTIERLTSSTFRHTLQYNFTTHTTSLRTVEYSTTSSFDFTTDSTLYIIGNQLTTTRAILGVEGHGVYYKAA